MAAKGIGVYMAAKGIGVYIWQLRALGSIYGS